MATRLGTTLVVAGAVLLAPGIARAAVVEVVPGDGGEKALHYTGDPGEANNAIVSYDRRSQEFRVSDDGATALIAGEGCETVDVQSVTCSGVGVTTMKLDGGDGDDKIQDNVPPIPGSSVRWVEIDGGDGNDALLGSDLDESFDGGAGADYISGGRGTDSVTEDGVDAAGNGVHVTLDKQANDGVPGEGDNIRGNIEYIIGGPGPDTLIGNNGAHHMYGSGGNDQIYGKGGDDDIAGGAGTDLLSGGAGRDRVDSVDPSGASADRVDCGSSWDEARGDALDSYATNCERYVFGGVAHHNRPTKESGTPPGLPAIVAPSVIVRSRKLLVIAGCRASAGCAGRIRITAAVRAHRGARLRSRTIARGIFHARAGQLKLLRLKLSRRTRRVAQRARRGVAYVVAYGELGGGAITRRRIRLR